MTRLKLILKGIWRWTLNLTLGFKLNGFHEFKNISLIRESEEQSFSARKIYLNTTRYESLKTFGNSSISDSQEYVDYLVVCKLAAEDEEVFKNFRLIEEYQSVLEHVTHSFGLKYLHKFKKSASPSKAKIVEAAKKIDRTSEAIRFYYHELGYISPTIVRYCKIASEIEGLFDKNIKSVFELGCGYGGQGLILDRIFELTSYVLCDLPEVLPLIQKFVSASAPRVSFNYQSNFSSSLERIDLFISNYAFSELRRDLQVEVISKVINKSNNGYMLYNELGAKQFGSYTASEIASLIPGARVLSEEPLTALGNCLVVWNSK